MDKRDAIEIAGKYANAEKSNPMVNEIIKYGQDININVV